MGKIGKLTIIWIIYTLNIGFLAAQQPPKPSLDLPLILDLEDALQRFYEAERDAQLKAFDAGKAGDWKDLLPSIGIGYTVSNAPRPTISWSPVSILNRKDTKRKQVLTRESITLTYESIITGHLFKLRQLVSDYYIDLEALQTKERILHLDERLYEIVEEQYKQDLIKPSEYLQQQKQILLARASVDTYKQELQRKRSEVIYTARWEN